MKVKSGRKKREIILSSVRKDLFPLNNDFPISNVYRVFMSGAEIIFVWFACLGNH